MTKPYLGTLSDATLPYLIYEAPPESGRACTLLLSPFHGKGRVSVKFGSQTVRGHDADFADHLVKRVFQVTNDSAEYMVSSVDAGQGRAHPRPTLRGGRRAVGDLRPAQPVLR